MMIVRILVFSCVGFALVSSLQVTLEADRPSLRVQVSHKAVLQCCYSSSGGAVEEIWLKFVQVRDTSDIVSVSLNMSDNRITIQKNQTSNERRCSILTITEVQFHDSGMYQCLLNYSDLKDQIYTHGTFLQIYKPMDKIINLRESTKNKILMVEGILLMLCVLLPGTTLLYKSKMVRELETKKKQNEEDNIYEGLNLEDCCPAYDQIARTLVQDLYQDVDNCAEEESQLEKP